MFGNIDLDLQALFQGLDHAALVGNAANKGQLPGQVHALQQQPRAAGQGVVNSAQNVLHGNAGADMIDDLALGQNGADAGDGLGIFGRERQFTHVAHFHLQVLGGAHDETAGAGGALVVGLEGADAATGGKADG